MRHLTTKLMIPLLAVILLAGAPKQAQAQVECADSGTLLNLAQTAGNALGASLLGDAIFSVAGITVKVSDSATHNLLAAQTGVITGHMQGLIESQTAICQNLFAILQAIGYVGPQTEVPTVNLPLYAAKAYKYYIGSSKSIARNGGDYGTGSSFPVPTANSGPFDPNSTRSQQKVPTKAPIGQGNIPEVLRVPSGNQNTNQTQPANNSTFNPNDPAAKEPAKSGVPGSALPNVFTPPINGDPAADPFNDGMRSGREQRRPAFIDIPQASTVPGAIGAKPDPKLSVGQQNIPEPLRAPTAGAPAQQAPAGPDGVLGDLQGINETLNAVNVDQAVADVMGDFIGPIQQQIEGILGPVFNQIANVQGYFSAAKDLFSSVQDIFSSVTSIFQRVSEIWEDTFSLLSGMFQDPLKWFGVQNHIDQLTGQINMLMMPLNELSNDFMGTILRETGGAEFLANMEAILGGLATVPAAYPGSDWAGNNPFNVDPQVDLGIASAQQIEHSLSMMVGEGTCPRDADGRLDATCANAMEIQRQLFGAMAARRQATTNFARVNTQSLFLKKLVMGDELTGECDDLARDENCLTLVNMMRHSINLRHDIQVQTAVQYTDMLVNMLQLETLATNGFYDGLEKMIAVGTAPGGG